MSGMKEKAVWF